MFFNVLFPVILYQTTLANGANKHESFLFHIVFLYLAGLGVVFGLFGPSILRKLKNNDKLRKKVKPRLFGFTWLLCNEILCIAISFLAVSIKSITFASMFILLSLAHGIYMASILTTRLDCRKHHLCYKTLFRSRMIGMSEVLDARWISQGRSFGYTLVLYLSDGSEITLLQTHFIGLNYLWEQFGTKY